MLIARGVGVASDRAQVQLLGILVVSLRRVKKREVVHAIAGCGTLHPEVLRGQRECGCGASQRLLGLPSLNEFDDALVDSVDGLGGDLRILFRHCMRPFLEMISSDWLEPYWRARTDLGPKARQVYLILGVQKSRSRPRARARQRPRRRGRTRVSGLTSWGAESEVYSEAR
jgi:hypothetical protein